MLGFLSRVGLQFYSTTSLWTPALLFADGEPGVWYDPSDFSTMFQDAAGTTPVTAVEQPVGLLLDKSKGLALGSELVTNGTFDTNTTGWTTNNSPTTSIDSQRVKIIGTGGSSGIWQDVTLDASKSYEIKGAITTDATSALPCVIALRQGGAGTFSSISGYSDASAAPGASTNARWVLSGRSVVRIFLAAGYAGSGGIAFFDNISVRELPGNHASQSTIGLRPVLSARVNLLTYSEQFDNAAWGKFAGWAVGPTPATDPIGGLTADAIIPTAGTTLPYTFRAVTVPAAEITLSYYIKQGTSGQQWVQLGDVNHTNGRAWFNLTNGVVGTKQAGINTSSITAVGNGWFLVKVTLTKANTSCEYFIQPASADNNTGTTISWNGTDSAFFLWGADLRVTNVGSNMPAYQRVGAATYGTSTVAGNPDYDTSGFPFFLGFNGITGSRWMVSSTITPGTDKAQVFAGARKLSDAATGILTELSISASTNNGAFDITAPNGTGFGFELKGNSPSTFYTPQGFASPITNVLTGLFDIGGAERATEVIPRVNGILSQSGAGGGSDTGTGDFNAYPLYIGARAGSGFYYNGNLYELIVRFGPNLSEATIDQTEVWVGDKTGLNLSFATQQTIFDRFNATVLDRAGTTILQRY